MRLLLPSSRTHRAYSVVSAALLIVTIAIACSDGGDGHGRMRPGDVTPGS